MFEDQRALWKYFVQLLSMELADFAGSEVWE